MVLAGKSTSTKRLKPQKVSILHLGARAANEGRRREKGSTMTEKAVDKDSHSCSSKLLTISYTSGLSRTARQSIGRSGDQVKKSVTAASSKFLLR